VLVITSRAALAFGSIEVIGSSGEKLCVTTPRRWRIASWRAGMPGGVGQAPALEESNCINNRAPRGHEEGTFPFAATSVEDAQAFNSVKQHYELD
jgi:hypothetical protein